MRKALRAKGERTNEGECRKELNALKKEKYLWMCEATKCAVQLAIKNGFANAMKHFRGKEKFGFPRFKKKGGNKSFRMDYTALACLDEIRKGGQALKIPNMDCALKMAEPFRFNGKKLAVAISRKADQRYASISVETDISGAIKAYQFPESKTKLPALI